MKQFFLLLQLIGSLSVLAQDSTNKWSWGAFTGVERNYRLLDTPLSEDRDRWNGVEKSVNRISGGLRFERKLNNRFSFSAGLMYADRGYQIDSIQEAAIHGLNFHYRYVELPIGIFFTTALHGKNNLLLGVSAACAYNLSDGVFYFKDGQTAQFEMHAGQFDDIAFNVSAMLGVRRTLSNTVNLDVYVNGAQSIFGIASGDYIRRLNALGLFLALSNRF